MPQEMPQLHVSSSLEDPHQERSLFCHRPPTATGTLGISSSSFIPGAGTAADQRERGRVRDPQRCPGERNSFGEYPFRHQQPLLPAGTALWELRAAWETHLQPWAWGPPIDHRELEFSLQQDQRWWHWEQRRMLSWPCPGKAEERPL